MKMRPDRTDAYDLAVIAAEIARAHFRNPLDITLKADESPVTHADLAVETAIRAEIARRFPQHGIYGEEFGKSGAMADGFWIIDPIDGTRSFLSGNPLFGFLLGFFAPDGQAIGVVGMPMLNEIYTASAGGGPVPLVKVPAPGLVVDVVEETVLGDQESVALERSGWGSKSGQAGRKRKEKRKETKHR